MERVKEKSRLVDSLRDYKTRLLSSPRIDRESLRHGDGTHESCRQFTHLHLSLPQVMQYAQGVSVGLSRTPCQNKKSRRGWDIRYRHIPPVNAVERKSFLGLNLT